MTLGGYEMYVSPGFTEPVAKPTRSQQVVLEGTMNRTPVRVTVSPEVGEQCINSQQNRVNSVDACAGLSTCNLWARVVVEQLNADATTTVLATYLPPQCQHRTSSEMVWSSRLETSNGLVAVIGVGSRTGESHQLDLLESPSRPGVLTADPDFRFSDFPKGVHFELHFVAQP